LGGYPGCMRRRSSRTSPYAGGMLWLLIIIGVVVLAYVYRVQLLSKVLGQDEARVRRMLERRKGGR